MALHRSARAPLGATTNSRHRWTDPEVTDIIPFDEFGSLDDLDFLVNAAFDTEAQVLRAPELDDLSDTDNLTPLVLVVPGEFRADPASTRHAAEASDEGGAVRAARGLHRKEPTTAGVVKGRLLIAAMATGAAAAAAHSAVQTADSHTSQTVLAADESTIAGATIQKTSSGVELVTVTPGMTAPL